MIGILLNPIVMLVIVGVLSGLVGILAITHHRVFYAESITHGTFPGAVLGVVAGSHLGLDLNGLAVALMVGAAIMCLPLAWLMHRLAESITSQAAAGIVLTLGFALGYFLNTWFAPLPLKIESFLTGNVLTVTTTDIVAAAITLCAVAVGMWLLWPRLVAVAFDPQGYAATGVPPGPLHAFVLFSITTTLVVLIPAVGTILAIAVLVAPAAGLIPLLKTPRTVLWGAPLAGVAIGLSGLAVALAGDLSVGGCIALAAGIFYVACRIVARTHVRVR